jgi:hypothetical protein
MDFTTEGVADRFSLASVSVELAQAGVESGDPLRELDAPDLGDPARIGESFRRTP